MFFVSRKRALQKMAEGRTATSSRISVPSQTAASCIRQRNGKRSRSGLLLQQACQCHLAYLDPDPTSSAAPVQQKNVLKRS